MTGCAIAGCKNRSEDGFYMKRFPQDKEIQKLWLQQIGRNNWKPKRYTAICETYFAEEMWEKTRQDGSKKLKIKAIPTMFSVYNDKREVTTTSIITIPAQNNSCLSSIDIQDVHDQAIHCNNHLQALPNTNYAVVIY
ncbi:THAP domain-containing protein 4-like isoform X1 [Harpegnathos saltator]|uniref:THAP domain-containing protein 4-like isoform X1 n=1 Tax=Harpegnathos saltator TaxID=610380 RepID=UPI000DBEE5A6|nr:THAP domain-containing protein 4-like isoform X1 [Harpegnathos saltator]